MRRVLARARALARVRLHFAAGAVPRELTRLALGLQSPPTTRCLRRGLRRQARGRTEQTRSAQGDERPRLGPVEGMSLAGRDALPGVAAFPAARQKATPPRRSGR